MPTKRIECANSRMMECVLAGMQEIYTHVEFISYDGRVLNVAYIA